MNTMDWNQFLRSSIGNIFLEQHSIFKQSFESIKIQSDWNISKDTELFLSKFGWFPGENGFLPFTTFVCSKDLLKQNSPNVQKYNYKIIAQIGANLEVGIPNSKIDTTFLIDHEGKCRYFAQSIPLIICYGMMEFYVTKQCFEIKLEKDDNKKKRHHIWEFWQEVNKVFSLWDPGLWEHGQSFIANRIYDISELAQDIKNRNEDW